MARIATKGLQGLILLASLVLSTNTWAISASPTTTYSGSYTVSWSQATGCIWGFGGWQCYYLQEKIGSGSWINIATSSNATSKSFSGKSTNTYQYRIIWDLSPVMVLEGPITVSVVNAGTPSTPSGPSTSNTGSYTITSGVSTGAVRYQIQRRLSGGGWTTYNNGSSRSKAFSQGNGTWQYRSRGCGATNYTYCGSWSGIRTVNVAITPGVPSSITAPATDNNGAFTVSWGSGSGSVTKYQTYQRKDSGSWVNIHNSSGLSRAVSGLADGSYQYRVRACRTTSSYTSCSGYRTQSGSTVVTNLPGVPNGGNAINGPASDADGSFSLTWSAASGAVDTYKLERRKDSGSWSEIQNTSSLTRNEAFTQPENGIYDYRVAACNVSGCGSTTPIKTVSVYIPLDPPSQPQWNLSPSSSDFGDYDISWFAPSGTVTYYTFQERLNNGSWAAVSPTSTLTYDARGKPQGEYDYRVQACNVDACSSWSTLLNVDVHNLEGIAPVVTIESTNLAAGTSPYSARVNDIGSALISVPVRVYPGVNGLQPSLSVRYSSGRPRQQIDDELPEDTLGYGFNLAGFSSIRRCVTGQSVASSVQLTNADSLCLDGEPLVLVSGTHLTVGAEYRTMRESYRKIEQKGTANEPWYEVTHPDGSISQYGNDADARVKVVDASQSSPYFAWSLNQRTDAFGNSITYTYHADTLNGVNYPLSISYADATITFEYATRDDAAPMALGTIDQGQLVLLHTIEVKFDDGTGDKLVREYRLASETAPEGWKRLSQLQECGYDQTGANPSCMAPLVFDWMTAGVLIPDDFKTGVERVTDGLNAEVEFDHSVITDTGTNNMLFLERPFGNEISIPNTTGLTPATDGSLKCVVTEMRRSNGLGSMHSTTYAYHGKGLMSTQNWGFLGFYAQRIKDEASGIVTYRQFRQDYPYFGRTSAVHQYEVAYNGTQDEQLSQVETHYTKKTTADTTEVVYVSERNRLIFEEDDSTSDNVQLGIEQQTFTYTFDSNDFISSIDSTTQVAESSTTSGGGSFWGDVESHALTTILRSTQTDSDFTHRTTGSDWLIGFADRLEQRSYDGDAVVANLDQTQVVELTPHTSSNAIDEIVNFPADTEYELTTSFVYDSNGNRTETTQVGQNVSSRTSKALSFTESRYPQTLRNALNKDTAIVYDKRFGRAKQVTDPNSRVTYITYDAFGRETQRTTPDGVNINTSYDECNLVIICDQVNGITPAMRVQTTSSITPTRTQYLDTLGRLVRTEVASFTGTNPIRRDTYFDSQGRVDRVSQPYFKGSTESFNIVTYDLRNRVTKTDHPDGSSTDVDYDADPTNKLVQLTVDKVLKAADGTSAGTQTKVSDFNILGELTSTTDAHGTTDAITTTFAYYGSGLPESTTVHESGTVTHTTSYEYDDAGNRTKLIGPNVGTIENKYTALGQVRWQKDAKLQVTTFLYDVLGRLTSRTDPDGTHDWNYDPTNAFGALASRTDNYGTNESFTETHTYNTSAQLTNTETVIDVPGYSKTYDHDYTYDSDGRIDKITYPSGIQVQYGYNTRGYLATITDMSSSTVLQTYSDTDAFGNITDEEYGNDVETIRVYDAKTGRLKSIDTSLINSPFTAFQDNDYAWRSDGILESRINNLGTTIKKETFDYDELNRLEDAKTYLGGTLSRTLTTAYDKLGNITSKTSSVAGEVDVTGYQYGNTTNAGPHALSDVTIDGIANDLSYDANGNVTEYNAATGDDKYISWNARNLPTKITVGDSAMDTTPTARDEFRYGPGGQDAQRYYKKSTYDVSGTQHIEHTFYVGSFEEIIPEGTGAIEVKKTQVTSNVLHVKTNEMGNPESIEYLHRDHLGSVEAITDENGNQLQLQAYDPFGERREEDWTGTITQTTLDTLLANANKRTSRGYTGHEHLDRTGIIHMNGRIYDPQLGRFLSPDPIVQVPTNSQSWNRYTYVFNSPLSFTDPSGFIGECVFCGSSTLENNRKPGERNPDDISGFAEKFGNLGIEELTRIFAAIVASLPCEQRGDCASTPPPESEEQACIGSDCGPATPVEDQETAGSSIGGENGANNGPFSDRFGDGILVAEGPVDFGVPDVGPVDFKKEIDILTGANRRDTGPVDLGNLDQDVLRDVVQQQTMIDAAEDIAGITAATIEAAALGGPLFGTVKRAFTTLQLLNAVGREPNLGPEPPILNSPRPPGVSGSPNP